jgi:hypothetical protein
MTNYEMPDILRYSGIVFNLLKNQTFMSQHNLPQFVEFLCQELCIPHKSIQLGLKQSHSNYGSLPMVFWQYGLISLNQLDRIYDWFESYIY